MSISVSIQGVTYQIAVPNEQSWGQPTTDLLIAMVDSINTATNVGDIPDTTQVIILNNQTSPGNVTNLVFDSSDNKAAFVDYTIYRVKGSLELMEEGTIRVSYKPEAGVWTMDRTYGNDDSGVALDIDTSGQVTYTSSNITDPGTYSGIMRYRARALIQ